MEEIYWMLFGFASQFFFFLRFFIQWVTSEIKGKSIIPNSFWYFSIVGGTGIFVYSLHVGDIVFILGTGLALFFYVRNLCLIHRKPKLFRKKFRPSDEKPIVDYYLKQKKIFWKPETKTMPCLKESMDVFQLGYLHYLKEDLGGNLNIVIIGKDNKMIMCILFKDREGELVV